jgi:hypothetical protein
MRKKIEIERQASYPDVDLDASVSGYFHKDGTPH